MNKLNLNSTVIFAVVDSVSGDCSNIFAEYEQAEAFFYNTENIDLKDNYNFSLVAVSVDEHGGIFWETSKRILSGEVICGNIFFYNKH